MTYAHKYARIECERKFLLQNVPSDIDLKRNFKLFEDCYFPNTRMRLRKVSDANGELIEYKLTQKYREESQPAHETIITNIYLNPEEASLFSSLAGNKIIKKRYSYLYNGSGYGIEIFEGKLAGLLLAEIEAGYEQLSAFKLPNFILEDVTHDPFFFGGHLATVNRKSLLNILDERMKPNK